jgi:hypothetical protein
MTYGQAGGETVRGLAGHEDKGRTMVEINWQIVPFRGDRFAELWARPAAAVLDYGAHAYSFDRSKDDPLKFKQVSYFDTKTEWERYWFSEEISDARTQIAGLYQVPLAFGWYKVVGADRRTIEELAETGTAERAGY